MKSTINLSKNWYSKEEVITMLNQVEEAVSTKLLEEDLIRLNKKDCDLERIENLIACFNTDPKRIKAEA